MRPLCSTTQRLYVHRASSYRIYIYVYLNAQPSIGSRARRSIRWCTKVIFVNTRRDNHRAPYWRSGFTGAQVPPMRTYSGLKYTYIRVQMYAFICMLSIHVYTHKWQTPHTQHQTPIHTQQTPMIVDDGDNDNDDDDINGVRFSDANNPSAQNNPPTTFATIPYSIYRGSR